MAEILHELSIVIETIILALGYPGIVLVMFLENVFPPIPSELVMPFGGFIASRGKLSIGGVVLSGVVGSVLGALVLYYVGRWAQDRVIRQFVRRYGRFFLLSETDLDRVLRFFERYGDVIVCVGRVIPLVRSLISIPAGMNRMPLTRFVLFTALGSALWNGVLAYAGLALGDNWESFLGIMKQYERVVLVAVAVVLFVPLAWRVTNLLKARSQRQSAPLIGDVEQI